MNTTWNDDWRDELKLTNGICYDRLCECRNTLRDVEIMARLVYKYNQGKSKSDCLDRTIEWVGDWNGQYLLVDKMTKSWYNDTMLKM